MVLRNPHPLKIILMLEVTEFFYMSNTGIRNVKIGI
jgi:hypothetical protein